MRFPGRTADPKISLRNRRSEVRILSGAFVWRFLLPLRQWHSRLRCRRDSAAGSRGDTISGRDCTTTRTGPSDFATYRAPEWRFAMRFKSLLGIAVCMAALTGVGASAALAG